MQPIVRASVTAARHELTTLTDSLTWMLLRGLWRARAPPTPNVSAVTTQPPPALRAFLGERAGLEGRWAAAADAFARGMRAPGWGHDWSTRAEFEFDIPRVYRLELELARGTGIELAFFRQSDAGSG